MPIQEETSKKINNSNLIYVTFTLKNTLRMKFLYYSIFPVEAGIKLIKREKDSIK